MMRQRNLLFARNLFLPEDLGGNRYPYETMRRFGERGYAVTVVTPRLHDRFPALPNVRYQFYRASRAHASLTHVTNLIGSALAVRKLRGFEVAISGSYDTALALSWAGIAPTTPLVFLYHSEFYSEWVQARGPARVLLRNYMAEIERQVFDISARIVAVSQFSARQISERSPRASTKVRVVPTGVDTSFFCPPASKVDAKLALGLPAEVPLLLGVGRLAGVKQFDRLITAFAAAHAQGLQARLVIAGEGPERPKLQRLIDLYGVAEHVQLAGYCDPPHLRAWLQAADLQVCSSAFENLSLAILEGMACATACLGTPGGGTPELVGAVDPELALPSHEPAALADALPKWLAQPQRLEDLGQRARALTEQRYDWDRVVDGLEHICQEVVPQWS
jgi:glycosyltransferase involved in cell wall biosynthesis